MCDVESYIYMPLLEELGYMPRHKYASGNELREYANKIADKWDLYRAAVFKTLASDLKWDESKKGWEVEATQEGRGEAGRTMVTIDADFVILSPGILSIPKLPKVPGIDDYRGHTFHTSRWDYAYTGGSADDPSLVNLKDKRVGIIGTGATAIQAIPQLAKWAKELYVFQRTPSAVDRRDNRETDRQWWERDVLSRGKGWQKERKENFNDIISNVSPLPEIDLVSDGWTNMKSYCVLAGGPKNLEPDFIAYVQKTDLPRQERIRARVDEIVKDVETARSLKAWYYGWCKRPCFHDEYLQTFNQPHVKLIDTDGMGVSHFTENGLVVKDKGQYDLDLIIFSTGFNLPIGGSPGARSNTSVTGRGGEDMEEKWTVKGAATLHGCVTRDFPNLFFPGPNQAGASPNFVYMLDSIAAHVAYIISESTKRGSKEGSAKVVVEPTTEGEEAWAMQTAYRARGLAAMAGCTPSYLNGEGATLNSDAGMEQMMKVARLGSWGEGVGSYVRIMEDWRAKGDMEGLEIKW
jgi:cation diffusion facilitator CzcD-associated flavoprotein CzcO